MIPNLNLSEAKRETIEPGGYVCRVLSAAQDLKYNRLQLQLDIVDGPHAGYFSRLYERFGFWGLTGNMPMEKGQLWKFANTIQAFRDSNVDFTWEDDGENDERSLVNMYIGAVVSRHHYMGNDGKEKTKTRVYMMLPVEDIRNGLFEIPEDSFAPELKPQQPVGVVTDLSGGGNPEPAELPPEFVASADEEMPF